MLLTEFSESFKLAAHIPDHGSTSLTQASAAQPESSHKLKTTKQGRKPLKIDVDASKAGVDHVRENLIDVSPLIDFDDFEFVYDFDTEAAGSSRSQEGKAEPSLSKLMKLTEEDAEYDESPYKANQQSLSDLLLELPAPSNESPAKRNISPPLEHALARRASILSYKAPGASSLRNEAHGQVKGPVADADPLIPPIVLFKEASGSPKVKWHIPPEIEETLELEFRPSGTGLFAHEWVKVPIEFRHHSQNTLARFWDLTYNSVVRKTVLLYKRKLATAGKADQVLDWPNRLLAALVDIQEFDIQEGAEHVFDTSDTKTSKRKLSVPAIPEESAGFSGNNILIAALREVNLSLANPNDDTFTAQEKLALSKGVKLGSQNAPILTEVLTDFYKELPALRYSSKMATTLNDREKIISEKLALLELQALGIGKGEESELAMEDATTGKGKGKGKEGDRLVEGSVSGKGKDRENELPLEDAKTGKGKAKESDMLVKDPAIGEGIGKENGSPVKDTTIGKGKGKNKGKGKSKSKRKGKGKAKAKAKGKRASSSWKVQLSTKAKAKRVITMRQRSARYSMRSSWEPKLSSSTPSPRDSSKPCLSTFH
ncbi:hypothetical protein HO173_003038 [Letharia columbiana]|uniref:Uncharacterized protein n=1 Tax=Letharia columbiana TaxID=112416 RepID=A0A8H6G104_9LECA|nr:uncharacterized protein HO173_003038 [Letharia columbiana]KAF6238533.1 hypothetical protein HO173_003038 [Letharia columbiana]